jgi:hypothetical protein
MLNAFSRLSVRAGDPRGNLLILDNYPLRSPNASRRGNTLQLSSRRAPTRKANVTINATVADGNSDLRKGIVRGALEGISLDIVDARQKYVLPRRPLAHFSVGARQSDLERISLAQHLPWERRMIWKNWDLN